MNLFKKAIFKIYILYYNRFPLVNGKYFVGRMLYRLLGYAIYQFEGIRMALHPISLIDRKIIERKDHDPDVKRMIASELAGGGIFVDVGANIGYFALLAAVNPAVEVFAFEPSLRERDRFYHNMQLNGFSNITISPYGLSDKFQRLKLAIARDWNPGLNSFVNDLGTEEVDSVEVSCYDFDALFTSQMASKVKLVKIDVEGYEMAVLEGMRKSMPSLKSAKFVVEINSRFLSRANTSVEEIYLFFESFGFKGEKGRSQEAYDEVFFAA